MVFYFEKLKELKRLILLIVINYKFEKTLQ